jgi:hypothetical protein
MVNPSTFKMQPSSWGFGMILQLFLSRYKKLSACKLSSQNMSTNKHLQITARKLKASSKTTTKNHKLESY